MTAPAPLQPHERLADQLYGRILDQIVAGGLKEGDKLPSEHQICRTFQVSRPTVREALTRLNVDGVVITRKGSGTYVQRRPSDNLMRLAEGLDLAEILRSLELRIALEGRAAVLAAQRRRPDQMQAIAAALTALRRSFGDGTPSAAIDFAFHRAVAVASGNSLFAEVLQTLETTVQSAMRLSLGLTREGSKDRARRVLEEHEAIADAIRRQDGEAAGLAMRHHLHQARQRMTDGRKDR